MAQSRRFRKYLCLQQKMAVNAKFWIPVFCVETLELVAIDP